MGHDYREHVEAYRLEHAPDLTERLNMTDGLDDLPEDARVSVGGLLRPREFQDAEILTKIHDGDNAWL